MGMDVALACPQHYEPRRDVEARAHETAALTGGRVEIQSDPFAAVRGAAAVYTDVWASMGDETERDRRSHALAAYRVDETHGERRSGRDLPALPPGPPRPGGHGERDSTDLPPPSLSRRRIAFPASKRCSTRS